MLELKNIMKEYTTGEETVQAVKEINLKFRKSEFVSILGPSGGGKTTLLNIIGGLDQYSSGDLIINGKSTKDFADKDWDTYRNHSVGFIFQSYNLIPHQTVLANVELALTLSGVSKDERRKRAVEVLEKVGLKDHVNKRPNQMSGGQMQRVAIARALINDPEILLADEPTGALDTETSVQIMNLLKEIAQDKLIIMVTHNPELAEEYSSRIIRLLDGKVLDDSNPCDMTGVRESSVEKSGKTFMSFFTALSLSLNNLMTKKGRTLLTAFAGSIGIIGIALIMSLSNGVQRYISKIEEDTLSSYPIALEETSLDMTAMMDAMMGISEDEEAATEEGVIESKPLMNDMLDTLSSKQQSNNLGEFKGFIENGDSNIKEVSNAVQYAYDLPINIYNTNGDGGIVQVNPSQVMNSLGMGQMTEMQSSMGAPMMASNETWEELLSNQELLESQYDMVDGRLPDSYNEVVLIVDENTEISDYMLYSLGLLSQDELADNFEALQNDREIKTAEQKTYTYDDFLDMSFKLVLNTDYFQKQNGLWVDQSENEDYMQSVIEDSQDINIVGIMRPNAETVSSSSTGSIGYTSGLTEHVIQEVNDSQIVKEQNENPDTNVFTGLAFNEDASSDSFDYAALSQEQQVQMASLSETELAEMMVTYQENSNATLDSNLTKLGSVDIDDPSKINIYPKDFESKEEIASIITAYNEDQTAAGNDENVIAYSDLMGTMMSSVTSIIDIVSYVLMAFVGVSLVVSSIMIGIITYISVLERTKEIGILRSIGASKKDISHVFNAETFIIGLLSGVIGIVTTVLLNIPISMIIENMTGIANIASLPWVSGVVLIVISMLLTVIAGLIPSNFASKKDPVEALRTE